jgi:putative transposase
VRFPRRKRHLLIDTQGLVLKARVHCAVIIDREGVELLLDKNNKEELPRMEHPWLDGGYRGML